MVREKEKEEPERMRVCAYGTRARSAHPLQVLLEIGLHEGEEPVA